MKLNGKQYDKFILNGKTYEKFYLNNKIYQSLDPGLILDLPLQNNFTDYSASGISMVAGNANGLPSFISDGSGGFALDFNGTKSIKTAVNLPINTSDKVSFEFEIKTTSKALQVILELSPNINVNNSFASFINNLVANRIDISDHNSGYNIGNSSVNINDGNYHSVKMIIDRSLGTAQNKIYVDGVLSYVQNVSYTTDNNGNFGSFTLFIGQRNGSSLGFVGQLTRLRIYNYPIVGVIPPHLTGKSVVILGDSTMSAYSCRGNSVASKLLTPTDISNGWSATNIAVAGHTINQQLTTWNAYGSKTSHDIIVIQVGLNDMNTASATTLTNYQSLINQINSTKKVGAKVYISCMLPAKQRWTDLGWVNGQSNWVALNTAIMDSTFTGVDGRNNYHVALLDDGVGNLAAAYDCGDHIHENQAGADIIITGFRTMIGL